MLVACLYPADADELVATVDELRAMRSADLDHVAGLSDGSIVLNVKVANPDPHLPSLQMRNPVSRQTSRAGAVRIERGGRHARKVYAAVSPVTGLRRCRGFRALRSPEASVPADLAGTATTAWSFGSTSARQRIGPGMAAGVTT